VSAKGKVAACLVLLAAALVRADEAATPVILIEPKFMKAPVTAPIPGAKKSELVAAEVSNGEVVYLSREKFGALGVDWKTFAAGTQPAADKELAALEIDYVRDRRKVIAYAEVRSPRGLVASAVQAPKFLELFKETLGEKVLLVIPHRGTAFVFPALASAYREYAPLVLKAYRATAFPVSTEVFELSTDGLRAIGMFEDP
jgi:hypothetical protein